MSFTAESVQFAVETAALHMSRAEVALLRVLSTSGKVAMLPFDIIKMIIRFVNNSGRIAHRRRRLKGRFYNDTTREFPGYGPGPNLFPTRITLPVIHPNYPYRHLFEEYYGPGY